MPQNPSVVMGGRARTQKEHGVQCCFIFTCLIYWTSVTDLIQGKSCLAKKFGKPLIYFGFISWETNPCGKKRKVCPWSHSKVVAEPGWEPRPLAPCQHSHSSFPVDLLQAMGTVTVWHFPRMAEMVSTRSLQGKRLSEA